MLVFRDLFTLINKWATSEFQNPHSREAKCRTFLVNRKWVLFVWESKNHLHIKGWALNLVLIQRPDGTRILPIADINFFISVPRYWRGTKVHGPCHRGLWFWFWTVNWSMRAIHVCVPECLTKKRLSFSSRVLCPFFSVNLLSSVYSAPKP